MAADTAPWMNSSSGRCKHPDDFLQVGVTGGAGQGPAFHAACRTGGERLIQSKGSPVSWVGLPDTGIAAAADQLKTAGLFCFHGAVDSKAEGQCSAWKMHVRPLRWGRLFSFLPLPFLFCNFSVEGVF